MNAHKCFLQLEEVFVFLRMRQQRDFCDSVSVVSCSVDLITGTDVQEAFL